MNLKCSFLFIDWGRFLLCWPNLMSAASHQGFLNFPQVVLACTRKSLLSKRNFFSRAPSHISRFFLANQVWILLDVKWEFLPFPLHFQHYYSISLHLWTLSFAVMFPLSTSNPKMSCILSLVPPCCHTTIEYFRKWLLLWQSLFCSFVEKISSDPQTLQKSFFPFILRTILSISSYLLPVGQILWIFRLFIFLFRNFISLIVLGSFLLILGIEGLCLKIFQPSVVTYLSAWADRFSPNLFV